jgi:molybdate transport system substrate-binding protein
MVTKSIKMSAGALLCLSAGLGSAEPYGRLPWPAELPSAAVPNASLYVSDKSNVVLDFHGSLQDPDLVIFMAGNQYPVLPDLVAAFRSWLSGQPQHRTVRAERIFYATTPPGRLIDAMDSGQLLLGNFWIDVRPDRLWPDVFMTGPRQQRRMQAAHYLDNWSVYTRNRGTVLLVAAGNPKNIQGVADLMREDVRVAISSPAREPASYESYGATLRALGGADFADRLLKKRNTISPVAVHHRENPQLIYEGIADVAPMYFHFGEYLKKRLPAYFDYVALPAEGNARDELAVSILNNAPRRSAAEAWVEFMRSDSAAAIYNRYGFEYVSVEKRSRREQQ